MIYLMSLSARHREMAWLQNISTIVTTLLLLVNCKLSNGFQRSGYIRHQTKINRNSNGNSRSISRQIRNNTTMIKSRRQNNQIPHSNSLHYGTFQCPQGCICIPPVITCIGLTVAPSLNDAPYNNEYHKIRLFGKYIFI